MNNNKTIKLRYFASLRELAQKSEETIQSKAKTCEDLYKQLQHTYDFPLDSHQVKVSVNQSFQDMSTSLNNEDEIVFIPPVAGG